VDALLAEFLREIRDEPGAVDLGSLIKTLLAQCSASGQPARPAHRHRRSLTTTNV
jgi:hypothetical protein